MLDALAVVTVLFVAAGGGIVVIDAFIIRRLRRDEHAERDRP